MVNYCRSGVAIALTNKVNIIFNGDITLIKHDIGCAHSAFLSLIPVYFNTIINTVLMNTFLAESCAKHMIKPFFVKHPWVICKQNLRRHREGTLTGYLSYTKLHNSNPRMFLLSEIRVHLIAQNDHNIVISHPIILYRLSVRRKMHGWFLCVNGWNSIFCPTTSVKFSQNICNSC